MINRYAGEIHINPMPILRNNDFNNEGHIPDIDRVLREVLRINAQVSNRLEQLRTALADDGLAKSATFHFAPGGYISVSGLTDAQLLNLNERGLIDLFDFALDKAWVLNYGHYFGLIWENGRAVKV